MTIKLHREQLSLCATKIFLVDFGNLMFEVCNRGVVIVDHSRYELHAFSNN